jgi:hypothetical protein
VDAIYKNGTYEDKFALDLHLDDSTESLADFHLQYGTNNNGNRTRLDLHFIFNRIIEFESYPHSQVYSGNATSIVSTWPIKGEKEKWGDWIDGSGPVNGIETYKYTISRGIFTIGIKMAVEDVIDENMKISPNSVKIDVEVHDFPYSTKVPTRLAISSTVRSKTTSKVSGEHAIINHQLIFDNDPDMPLGSYSWIPTAQYIDTGAAKDIPMTAWTSETQRGNNYDIFYTFVTLDDNMHPDSLIWDPTLGLDYSGEDPAFCIGSLCQGAAYGVLGGVAAVVVLIIVSIVVVVVRRKRSGYIAINE